MQTQVVGKWGEDLGCRYLENKGYRILNRNLHLGNQELDVVCIFEKCLVIIEIKTSIKNKFSCPEEMVNYRKLKNLKVAGAKLIKTSIFQGLELRFHLLAIEVDRVAKKAKIRHYKDII